MSSVTVSESIKQGTAGLPTAWGFVNHERCVTIDVKSVLLQNEANYSGGKRKRMGW